MKEMLLMLSQVTPEEMIIEELQKATLQYFTGDKEEAIRKIHFNSVLFAAKMATKDKDIFKMAQEMTEMERIRDRMTSAKS